MPSGLSVADNLARLWRYFSLEYELFRSVIGWVPRIASYDVKCRLVEHLHEDMRRTRALRERIGAHLSPADRRTRDRTIAAVQAALGDAFGDAWSSGRATPTDAVVAEALGGS